MKRCGEAWACQIWTHRPHEGVVGYVSLAPSQTKTGGPVRQNSMAASPDQLGGKHMSFIMLVHGDLIFAECEVGAPFSPMIFLGGGVRSEEPPRACAQRVLTGALGHRPPQDVEQGRLWLEGAAHRECTLEHDLSLIHI
mgnify:CR=1 FL=1